MVVYWMTAARRLGWNYALERAVELARQTRRPLMILEPLRVDYPWASDRFHAFLLQGMDSNRDRASKAGVLHYSPVESASTEGKDLLVELSRLAVAIVADDSPVFFFPRMLAAAAARVDCRLEAVDSYGLLPFRSTPKAFTSAYSFRRFLHSELRGHLLRPPEAEPLRGLELPRLELSDLPAEILRRWPPADERLLRGEAAAIAQLPIDHAVAPVAEAPGGEEEARRRLERFLAEGLPRYAEQRNHPDAEAASGLSPWLHFGHLSAHEVLARVGDLEGWLPETLPASGRGARAGWWGMSPDAEAFLDQLATWRELGANFALHRPEELESFDSLPDWVRATLEGHAGDEREWTYTLEQLESADTHDEIWNAAQRELRGAGTIQNYVRMLWGKKILEWSPDPRTALERMLSLNHRWALDGRDPNSASGILWCLGRYDRPWGPERPIFGTVRYMSSPSTRRKLRLDAWLRRWGPDGQLRL